LLVATVWRDGKEYQQEFEIGVPKYPVKEIGSSDKRGTKIQFKPDASIFTITEYNYDTLAARMRELATLRALGFNAQALVVSLLLESLLLALVGATAGIGAAYVAFDGNAISTLGGSRWDSQLVYSLTITPALALEATLLACVIGFVGGLIPALRAIRIPVAESLRTG
jgi:putative ABC transport system permease protein